MLGIHLDDEIKFFGLDVSQDSNLDSGFDENDYGFLIGAGYSISEQMSVNAGVYKGLMDHNGGKFNNFFIDLGYSF